MCFPPLGVITWLASATIHQFFSDIKIKNFRLYQHGTASVSARLFCVRIDIQTAHHMRPKLDFAMPVHNEGARIENTLREWYTELAEIKQPGK